MVIKKNHGYACRQAGFTLIEIIIIVGVLALIMVSLTSILSGVFNSQNKNKSNDLINQQGNWVIDEIKKNLVNSSSVGFTCPEGIGQSVSFLNIKNGDRTILSCSGSSGNYNIASSSANGANLFIKNNNLQITDCSNFVSCETLPSSEVSIVKVKFNLNANDVSSPAYVTKDFELNVTLRN